MPDLKQLERIARERGSLLTPEQEDKYVEKSTMIPIGRELNLGKEYFEDRLYSQIDPTYAVAGGMTAIRELARQEQAERTEGIITAVGIFVLLSLIIIFLLRQFKNFLK